MPTLIHERVRQAMRGENPTVLARLPSGWAVLGDQQYLPGYCLLLPDPVVVDLNALNTEERKQYLYDMSVIGDALLKVTDAFRINYEILGNTDAALHAHIFPRYAWEPEPYRLGPVFSYPRDMRNSRPFEPNRDRDLIQRLTFALPQHT